jgi:hypothetical protein
MSRTLPLLAAALCAAVLSFVDLQPCRGCDPLAAEQKIEEALGNPTEIDFIETPLDEVFDFLKSEHGIEIQIDRSALDEVGINSDTPITNSIKGISLRSALRLMLRQLDLTYMIEDEVLLITTPEEAETRLTTKIYPVGDLLSCSDESANFPGDGKTLIAVITSTVQSTTWDDVGGPGSIEGASFASVEMLIVSQTADVHEEIATLLANLRKVVASKQ